MSYKSAAMWSSRMLSIIIGNRTIEFIIGATNTKGETIPPFVGCGELVNQNNGNTYRPKLTGTWLVKNATAEHMAAMKKWFTDHDAASKAATKKAAKKAESKGKPQGKTSNSLAGYIAALEETKGEAFCAKVNDLATKRPALFAVANHYRTDGDTFHHKTGNEKLLNAIVDGNSLSDTIAVTDGEAVTLPPEVDDLFAGLC